MSKFFTKNNCVLARSENGTEYIICACDFEPVAEKIASLLNASLETIAKPQPLFERTYEIISVGGGEVDLKSVQKFPDIDGNGQHSDHVTIGELPVAMQLKFAIGLFNPVTLTISAGATWDK